MHYHPHNGPHHHAAGLHAGAARVTGLRISMYSQALLETLATQARLHLIQVTSVERRVEDQARIFFQKHVVEAKDANYKNAEVKKIIHHARALHKKGHAPEAVARYLVRSIESIHGGPKSISRHLGKSPFVEVFDVAHYSGPTLGKGRRNYMSGEQAKAFLKACLRQMDFPITRIGHSAELGLTLPAVFEFVDEKCFHLEVAQPFIERVTTPTGTMIT
jgi:hypothetical protein